MQNSIVSKFFVFTLILLFTGLLLAENYQKSSEKKKQKLSKQSSECLLLLDEKEKSAHAEAEAWNQLEAEFETKLRRHVKKMLETQELVNTKLDQLAEKLELYRKNPEEIIKAMDSWIEKRRSAIYAPVLDKLEVKIRKGSNSKTIKKESEQVFEKLRNDLPLKSINYDDVLTDILSWAYKKTEEQSADKKEQESANLSVEDIDDPFNPFDPCSGKYFSDKIKIEETINDWAEKRRMEIWGRLFDKLTEDKRLKKSKVEMTLKDIEKAFDELTRDLLREDNIQKELEKSLSEWQDNECKKEKEKEEKERKCEILLRNTSNTPSSTDEEKKQLLFDEHEFRRRMSEEEFEEFKKENDEKNAHEKMEDKK